MADKYNGMKRAKDWVGQRVELARDIGNGYYQLPGGYVGTITSQSSRGLAFEGDACPCCKVKPRLIRLGYFSVRLVAKQASVESHVTESALPMDKAYSVNGEDFIYCAADEVFQALSAEGRLVEDAVYYETDVERVRLADYLDAGRILEFAAEAIYDDVGEAAEDAFRAPQEAQDELNAFVAAWCEKHFKGDHYWRCRGRSRELKVTAEEAAES